LVGGYYFFALDVTILLGYLFKLSVYAECGHYYQSVVILNFCYKYMFVKVVY